MIELTPADLPDALASMETTMRFGPGVCARCGINHGPRTCEEYQSGLDIKSFDEPAPDTAPGITDAELREIARAICKSRTCEGGSCCQWPAMMARRIDCPVRRGAYDEAARDALAAMRAVASRTRPATPAPDALLHDVLLAIKRREAYPGELSYLDRQLNEILIRTPVPARSPGS